MEEFKLKEINDMCIRLIMEKKNICKCRTKACFHAGQVDLALKILLKNKFDIAKLKPLLIN